MPGRTFTTCDDANGIYGDRPFVSVPDGKWVLVAKRRFDLDGDPLESWEPDFETFGSIPQQVLLQQERTTHIGAGAIWETCLLVGSEPFGIVKRDYGSIYFEPARQVYKGQLGRRPPLPKLDVVRETEGKRLGRIVQNPVGWVRVTEVARLVEMDPLEMLLFYFDFDSGRKQDSGHHSVWIEEGTPEQIRASQTPCAHFPGSGVVGDVLEEIRENGRGESWIRLGFARTILYLHKFGWQATDTRRRQLRELIASLLKSAELLKSEHPERASEVETWVTELQLELA